MTVIYLKQITRQYKNNGQHAEQVARYTLTGRIEKADNRPFQMCADCNNIQIKGARATVCNGLDINEYLASDKANKYGYVTEDFSKMYLMSKSEYIEFVERFGTITTESEKNGNSKKIRLKQESREMKRWLER